MRVSIGVAGGVLVLAVVAGGGLGASLAKATETAEPGDVPVSKKDLPPAVSAAASRFADGLDLDHAVLADEDGLQVYELHYKKGHGDLVVQTTTRGDLFASEEAVAANDVPELVRERAAKLFPGNANVQFEKTTTVLYEVNTKDKRGVETEYLVNLAGAAFREIAGGIREAAH